MFYICLTVYDNLKINVAKIGADTANTYKYYKHF
jgi:hypothetical protein